MVADAFQVRPRHRPHVVRAVDQQDRVEQSRGMEEALLQQRLDDPGLAVQIQPFQFREEANLG